MGKPANRMITEGGSSGSDLVPTTATANRMITVSGSSGSGLVPTPANRMITKSGLVPTPANRMITKSGLVPTPANRMITVSGSSGSGLVPTPANRMITVSGLVPTPANIMITVSGLQVWQMTQNPLFSDPTGKLYEQVVRLCEEHIQDVRKMDIFDAISEKIRHLEEIPTAFYEKMIWRKKEAIAKDPVMKDLLRELIETIHYTSNMCNGLAKCLRMEKNKHDMLEKALGKVAPGSTPLGEVQLNKVKEKLGNFVKNAHRDPFEDLQQQFKSLLERYEQLRKKLEDKIKELSGKRKASRVWSRWSTVSGSLMAVLTAAAAITCVVVVVVAPPTAAVIGTALGLYATSMVSLNEMMLSFRGKQQNLRETEQLAQKFHRHSVNTEIYLKGIEVSMKGLNNFRAPIVDYVNNYLEDHDVLDLADIAVPIRELVGQLLRNLDDLVKKVDGCLTKLTEQIEDLKKPLL